MASRSRRWPPAGGPYGGAALSAFAAVLLLASAAALPAQDTRTYVVDREASTVGFTIDHFGVSEVFGEFDEFSGEIAYGGAPQSLDVTGRVIVESVDTGIGARDRTLMGEAYFHEAEYPEIRFRTIGIERTGRSEGRSGYVLVGELGIRAEEREVRLPVTVERREEALEIGIRGSFDRNDFEVRGGFGSAAIGDIVGVRVDLVARRE